MFMVILLIVKIAISRKRIPVLSLAHSLRSNRRRSSTLLPSGVQQSSHNLLCLFTFNIPELRSGPELAGGI
jgi:hypothetical protein